MSIKNVKQVKICAVLKQLSLLQKTTVRTEEKDGSINRIWVENEQQYVPNFCFEWCKTNEHYRVYIHVASTVMDKTRAGYSIFTVSNGLVAAGFVTLYAFIHKNRANNKDAA
jgi:hypothetical protein